MLQTPYRKTKSHEDFDPATQDPEEAEAGPCPDVLGLAIPVPSTGERMSAVLFRPQGEGPYPTVLLLHGFPGDEDNSDLAHAFQRAGYAALIFHYRGTWGSEGLFSLEHVLEDVSAVLDFIRNPSSREDYGLDAERLFLIGHSMGGFAALQTAAEDHRLLGVAAVAAFDFSLAASVPQIRDFIQAEFQDHLSIKRIAVEGLMEQIDRHAADWRFASLAEDLSPLPVCLVGASRDSVSAPEYHFAPLREALRHSESTTVRMLDTGHSLGSRRIELARTLLHWTGSLL